MRRTAVAIALVAGLTACAAEPAETIVQPTPQVIVVTPAPQEQPTPEVIEREVEVASKACLAALELADNTLIEAMGFVVGVLGDYVDYPDENLGEFGARVEDRIDEFTNHDTLNPAWDAYQEMADECRADR